MGRICLPVCVCVCLSVLLSRVCFSSPLAKSVLDMFAGTRVRMRGDFGQDVSHFLTSSLFAFSFSNKVQATSNKVFFSFCCCCHCL